MFPPYPPKNASLHVWKLLLYFTLGATCWYNCAVHTLPAQSGERASQHQSGHACFASSTPSRTLRGCLRHIDNDGADADSRCCSICYQYKATIYYQQELPGISNSSHCCNRRCGVPHQPGSSYALSMNTCRCMPRSAICSTKYTKYAKACKNYAKRCPNSPTPASIRVCIFQMYTLSKQNERVRVKIGDPRPSVASTDFASWQNLIPPALPLHWKQQS